MDEQKLTDWFPPEVPPARPGWYQREWPSHPSSATPDFFDGQNWFIGFNWRPYKYPLTVPLARSCRASVIRFACTSLAFRPVRRGVLFP